MGGKSSSAPPPDPRLVEAQIRSMGIQDGAIQSILDLQKKMQPLQEAQMQFGLDSSKTAFEQSQADREYALGRRGILTGLQDQMSSEASTFNTEAKREELASKAIGDVNSAFSSARGQSARDMARMGVNPNSGRAAALDGQMSIAQAAQTAGAANNARTMARAEGRALTDRASNALAGYPAMGMQTTGAGAQFAANGINIANGGMAGMSTGFGSAAQIAGNMGSNAGNMYGAMGSYKLGADQQAAANSPWGTLIGAGATLGAAYLGRK